MFTECQSVVPALYHEVIAIDVTNVHFALKFVFRWSWSLLLLPTLVLILKIMWLPSTYCSKDAACEAHSRSPPLERASLVLSQSPSYSQRVQIQCFIRHYMQFICSASIAPSYTFPPTNNVHPVLRKVIIKYSCFRNRYFIHRSAHIKCSSSTNLL